MTYKRFAALVCRALALSLLALSLLVPFGSPASAGGTVYMLVINVGKADAILVQLDGRAYLIDTGTKESVPLLLGALRMRGVTALDGVFITHSHDDHMGGLSALAGQIPIQSVYCAEIATLNKNGEHPVVKTSIKANLPGKMLCAGDTISVSEGVYFEAIGPLTYNEKDENDNSLVLRLRVNGVTILLTGDMQFAEEKSLMNAGVDVKADILKVGNHGNPDATSDAFGRAVNPPLSIISTDTTVDADTANPRVLAALPSKEIYNTQDFQTGVLVTIGEDGQYSVSDLSKSKTASLSITDVDKENQIVTLKNESDQALDLSGFMLFSETGNELYVFPEGAEAAAGASFTIACQGREGDFIWEDEKKAWSTKKTDPCWLYDAQGSLLDKSIQ